MRLLLCNWTKHSELLGGCESLFRDLEGVAKDIKPKMVTFSHANAVLGLNLEKKNMGFFECEASHIIDRYCRNYLNIFPKTNIISNAGIVNIWYKNKNTTNIFNDPYEFITKEMLRRGLHGAKEYNRYGMIAHNMQVKSAEGARNIAISGFMENEMKKAGVEIDRTIRHGIDTEVFKPMDRENLRKKYGIPDDKKVIIWSKDFHLAAGYHIVADLVNKFKDIYWVLNFKYKQNYRPKSKNVRILEPMDRAKMAEFYNLGDFLINPSIAESFGYVPLEAMSCGIPTILSNTGFVWEKDINEVVEKRKYGLLVSDWSTDAYAKAIEIMLKEESGFKPRNHVINEKLTLERWEKEWKDLICEICEGKS